jgi:hypothetical protein
MDWAGRPKRFRREIGWWVRGASLTNPDPLLVDALWLVQHPAWSWTDLQATPAEIIDLMTRAESAIAAARK